MSRRVSVPGGFPAFPVAATLLLLRLAHNKTTEASNHITNHRVKVLFLIPCPLLSDTMAIPPRAVFNRGETVSMTSEVMRGHAKTRREPGGSVVNKTPCFAIIGPQLARLE